MQYINPLREQELQKFKNYIIKIPKNSKFEIADFCEFLKNLSRILKGVTFCFSLNHVKKTVYYGFHIPVEYSEILENQIYTAYPMMEIEETEEDVSTEQGTKGAMVSPSLKYGDFFPFLDYTKQEGSILSDIISQISHLNENDIFRMRVKIRPIDCDRFSFIVKRNAALSIRGVKDRFNVLGGFFSKKSSPEVRARGMIKAREKNKQQLYLAKVDLLLFSESYGAAYAKLA